MPPTGSKSGQRNFGLIGQFYNWMQSDETGFGFDSSAGFTLPNGAVRAPDLAWIRKERWEVLSEDEQEEFAPICPDFVVELLSRTDRLETIKDKMQEYIDNGAQLGWLIDSRERDVYVYRPDEEVVCLSDPETISGGPLLPNFEFDVRRLWE
jgi:Uma2 family endonuclease